MTIPQVQLLHETIASGDWVLAANMALAADGIEAVVENKAEAFKALKTLEKNLAEANEFQKVSVLLWGDGMFNSRPSVVQSVFEEVIKNSKLLIMGGSSLSKTFSCGVLYYLLWRMDAYWTAVKLAAPSETHLYGNLFSHLVALHRASVLPMTENDKENIDINETELFISMHDALPEMRIQGVLCKQNQVSAGALRGHKPKPYRKPLHPVLGQWTRLFILIDEGSQVSPGAFEDLKTTEASIDESKGNVKIVIAFNPEEVSDKVVQMAEPEEGWDIEQVDTLYKWVSKLGYPVLRLDGKRFENVVQRKNVYQGMLSYEAYLGFLKAGEHSGQYWAKGRGFPPLKDNAYTIISAAWMQTQRGEPIYIGAVRNVGILDTALQGADKALFGVGRWGEASGWVDLKGNVITFKDRTNPNVEITRYVAVLDQMFQLPKTESTVEIMQEVMGRCKTMGIAPEDLVMDKMQPVSEPVLTPMGWKNIGDIKVGDYVIGSNGKPTKVIGVFPQTDRRVMKVSFTGGEWTRCGPDHLWKAQKRSRNFPEVITTSEILRDILESKTSQKTWHIPMLSYPVEYEKSIIPLPVDPYLLGCLLGDGNIRKYGVRFTTSDHEMVDSIRSKLPDGIIIKHSDRYDYSICSTKYTRKENGGDFGSGRNPLLDSLRLLGLAGVNSHAKFIPECYMTASPEDRIELLRGIMDTDGFVNVFKNQKKTASCGIRLTSERMIRQIMQITESLGGRATYRTHNSYGNNRKRGRDSHVTTLIFPDGITPFRLKRKADQFLKRKYPVARIIKSIAPCEDEDSVCIRVEAEDHLYATRHCILTHNTGNASGTHSHAKAYWGDVLGVDFGTKAEEAKVLAEDLNTAYDLYDGKVTELWFAAKRWMDPTVCALLINPIVPTAPLFTHITTRRYRNVKGGRVRVEPKEEYKARNQGVSPDEADIVCMLVEWCRRRGGVTPGIVEKREGDKSTQGEKVSTKNAEEYDSLEGAEFVSNNLDE